MRAGTRDGRACVPCLDARTPFESVAPCVLASEAACAVTARLGEAAGKVSGGNTEGVEPHRTCAPVVEEHMPAFMVIEIVLYVYCTPAPRASITVEQ